jgi:radical SAM protein with 4Fe4S-binding SPASM domain
MHIPRLPPLVGRYLFPARVIPPTRANVGRVYGSMRASYRRTPHADALPAALGIDVSDACNIACRVCSREVDWDKRDTALLSFDRFCHIYDQTRPVYLSLSGYGETLLNRRLPDMVAHATRAGSRVNVVTNGTLLDDTRASALLDAGLAKLKVSLDAAEPAVFARLREGGVLEEILGNVERLVMMRDARRLAGPMVEVQFTVCRDNLDQVEKLLHLCHDRLSGVQPYFHLMFTYGGQPGFVERSLPQGNPEAVATFGRAAALARAMGFVRSANSLETAITQLTRDLSSAPCYVPWYSALISTDGDVYPCCHHSIRGTCVGNVFETAFAEIWNGPAMGAFRERLGKSRCADKVCASCRYDDAPMDRVFKIAERLGM